MSRMVDADALIGRMIQAEVALGGNAEKRTEMDNNYFRLLGKEQGVALARSYVEELLRQNA